MRFMFNLVLVALFAILVAGCATMHRNINGQLDVSASAVTPRGAANLIEASARYTLAEAQAACMQDPQKCGWYTPVYQGRVLNATDMYYLRTIGLFQEENNRGAGAVLNEQLLYQLEKTEGELKESKKDFRTLTNQKLEQ